jgi:8-oxo-dGTP pyrophosphatase MutT (NUDIX family)
LPAESAESPAAQAQANTVAFAKPAATVVLSRDTPDGIEILLVERHGKLRFMGGMHVFPGGSLHSGDSSEQLQTQLTQPPGARRWPTTPDDPLTHSLAVTALRETFEEAGLWLGTACEPSQLRALRDRLLAGEDFAALLGGAGLALRPSLLHPLSRWITPRSEPIRFDTRFYVARAPHDQTASHDTRETVSLTWRSPRQALQDAHAGQLLLSPPTYLTLDELEGISSTDALIAHCASRDAPLIEPIVRVDGNVRTVLYPGDPEHPIKQRALKGPTRMVF